MLNCPFIRIHIHDLLLLAVAVAAVAVAVVVAVTSEVRLISDEFIVWEKDARKLKKKRKI